MTDSQRKLLNALMFTKITVDTDGVTGEELAEPFDILVPMGRYYTQHGALPAQQPETDADDDGGGDDGQPPPTWATAVLAGPSSNKPSWCTRQDSNLQPVDP
jgi:hypothetical protein